MPTKPPPDCIQRLNSNCCASFKISPVVWRKTTTLYFFKFSSLKMEASSVVSTVNSCSIPIAVIAFIPLGIEACLKLSVFEKTRTLISLLAGNNILQLHQVIAMTASRKANFLIILSFFVSFFDKCCGTFRIVEVCNLDVV